MRLKGGRYKGGLSTCFARDRAKIIATDCKLRGPAVLQVRVEGGPPASGVVVAIEAADACISRCRIQGGLAGILALDAIVIAAAVSTHICDSAHRMCRRCNPPAGVPAINYLLTRFRAGMAFSCICSRLNLRGGSVASPCDRAFFVEDEARLEERACRIPAPRARSRAWS